MKINKTVLLAALMLLMADKSLLAQSTISNASTLDDGAKERQYCVKTLTRIADPVLNALSKN